jgi:hypothetical protein
VRLDGRLGSPFRGWQCDQPCPVHERLSSGQLGEENNKHADCADDRGDSHKSTDRSLASLELEDSLKLAIVGLAIVGGRLMVDHALDPGRIPRILRRRQGHDRKAVRLHLRVDRWVLPTFDGRSSADILQASPAPVDDDRELLAAS